MFIVIVLGVLLIIGIAYVYKKVKALRASTAFNKVEEAFNKVKEAKNEACENLYGKQDAVNEAEKTLHATPEYKTYDKAEEAVEATPEYKKYEEAKKVENEAWYDVEETAEYQDYDEAMEEEAW